MRETTDTVRTTQTPASQSARNTALIGALSGVALTLTACGDDVPSGPMDEDQLESTLLTGRDIPQGWDLTDGPTGEDVYGDDISMALAVHYFTDIREATAGIADSQVCEDAQDDFDEALDDAELVGMAAASYEPSDQDRGTAVALSYSTSEEVDLADEAVALWETCYEDLVEDGDWAEDMELDDLGGDFDGVTAISDEADVGGVRAVGGESYGQNHLLARGFSSDPRDEEIFEELFDALKERFEEGPQGDD